MPAAAATVNVLAILPCAEDQTSLKEIFTHSKWKLGLAEALGPARPLLDELAAGVVISDQRLPDGSWQDVLLELQCRRVEPVLIVSSRLADDGLWAEVLNLGGCDVLATPFQAREVIRSVSFAWRHWQDKLARGRLPGKVMAAGSRRWQNDL
jgi:DNA-binding response OmpR family regulator